MHSLLLFLSSLFSLSPSLSLPLPPLAFSFSRIPSILAGPLAGEWSTASCLNRAHSGNEFNTGIINAVALHPDKDRAFSGSSDWEVKVWDVETATGLSNGRACGTADSRHSAAIRDIAVSKRNGLFATAGNDGKVLVWDTRVSMASNGSASNGSAAAASLEVSEKPVSGCIFEPAGLNGGGGNWIMTSDETGRICVYDLRKWELSRVVFDSKKANELKSSGSSWEGQGKAEVFKDLQISTEGWVCAVTETGVLYTWDPSDDWRMTKQPTAVKATSLTTSRITR